MKIYKLITIVLTLLAVGCATPPEVKQLSIKQMDYFDSAMSAVSIQSEALIMATERLVAEAKSRIDAEERVNRSRLIALIQRGGLDQAQSEDIAKRISDRSAQAVSAKEKLDSDLGSIRNKVEEINVYLSKMKEVHIAIDSYLQSEKSGEVVVNDVLNQPSVKSLLTQVNDLTPKIENGLSELTNLLNSL
ncbi:hypothetical protein [Vibrio owensii]|uniref:hypothetical protein n=1 Tax=Vibrio owensii TaxID=696485 RepID=UPI00406814F8